MLDDGLPPEQVCPIRRAIADRADVVPGPEWGRVSIVDDWAADLGEVLGSVCG
jgi:hypothetical protein